MLKMLLSRLPVQRLALVPLSGALFKRGIDDYLRLLRALEEAKNIRGVMLELESPGGAATASELLFERLKRLNDKKPLYCYCLMAASGGYMAALGARRIYAPSTALIGSIGVLTVKPVFKELMERYGIKLEVMKKGAMKDMSLFHRESTEEERRSWDALHEAVYERFIDMVAGRRGLERERVRELATGELFSAGRARDLGLIDGITDLDSALEELSAETGVRRQRTITVRPRRPLMKRLMSEAAASLSDEFMRQLYR
jgi:protease-4